MKKAGDLLFQLCRRGRFADFGRTGEKLPLDCRGKVILARDNSRTQALQDAFFLLDQSSTLFPICIRAAGLVFPSGQGSDQRVVSGRSIRLIGHRARLPRRDLTPVYGNRKLIVMFGCPADMRYGVVTLSCRVGGRLASQASSSDRGSLPRRVYRRRPESSVRLPCREVTLDIEVLSRVGCEFSARLFRR